MKTSCPLHKHTVDNSPGAAEDDCLCDMGYGTPDGSVCTICSVDTYKREVSNSVCTPCPDDTFTCTREGMTSRGACSPARDCGGEFDIFADGGGSTGSAQSVHSSSFLYISI